MRRRMIGRVPQRPRAMMSGEILRFGYEEEYLLS